MARSHSLHGSFGVLFLLSLVVFGCEDPTKVVQPPACTDCFADQDALIQGLASAYGARNYGNFVALFPAAQDDAPYRFFLNEPVNGVSGWDLTEELRIHRRMFLPDHPLPNETPVYPDLWLNSITITLARTGATWVERPDLYISQANPEGLDPLKWKATEAEYHTDVLFDTASDNDYRVDGRANFVVIEDLTKAAGAAGRFRIYIWEDLGNFGAKASVRPADWTALKRLYQ